MRAPYKRPNEKKILNEKYCIYKALYRPIYENLLLRIYTHLNNTKMSTSTLVSAPLLFSKVDCIAATLEDFTLRPALPATLIHVETTKYGGRGYFASTEIPSKTTVLSCDSPFTSAVYRDYKKDACAYCFKCDFHRPCKIKMSGPPSISPLCIDLQKCKKLSVAGSAKTAYAGLFFCSKECCDNWTKFEDPFGALSLVLNLTDLAVASSNSKNTPVEVQENSSHVPVETGISQAFIDQLWATESRPKQEQLPKTKAKQKTIPILDSAEHDNARIVACVIVKAYLLSKLTMADNTSRKTLTAYADEFATFNDLQSNELQLISAFPDLIFSHINVYRFLHAVLDKTPLQSFLSVSLFRSILGKEAGNAFGIWQFPVFIESECLGTAVYPSPSYFNHACEHNIEKQRKGRKMEFVTTRTIYAQEELYISYGMFEDCPVAERQKNLHDQWHFNCACPKCERELTLM